MVCELSEPLTVRRTVAVSSAVREGSVEVEGMRAELASSVADAQELARRGIVGVVVSPGLPDLGADVVVDARVAKRNIDTSLDDAGAEGLVIGIGPGFTAGVDCHAVVETRRGHHLGRVLWDGSAAPDTGTPGVVEGKGAERVLRAPAGGTVAWNVAIGDLVTAGETLGSIEDDALTSPLDGLVRGLIAPGVEVTAGTKIGDIDPRCDPSACLEISDKALSVGGGVVEAVLSWLNR